MPRPEPAAAESDASRRRLQHELNAWADGFKAVAGLDEAGRGPLAGPVVASAVWIDKIFLQAEADSFFSGLNDSKQMTATARERFFEKLTTDGRIRHGVGQASVEEIDRLNILRATHLAMQRALAVLVPALDLVLVDGLPVPGLPVKSRAIVKGDAQSFSIAAASVIAKVTRDRQMIEIDAQYSGYGFAQHKGYGTRDHIEAIHRLGPCAVHRKSFHPIRQLTVQS